MNFLERMEAGGHIAARYRAGTIDRETALIELTVAFDQTCITEQGIQSFLDDHRDSPRGGQPPIYDTCAVCAGLISRDPVRATIAAWRHTNPADAQDPYQHLAQPEDRP